MHTLAIYLVGDNLLLLDARELLSYLLESAQEKEFKTDFSKRTSTNGTTYSFLVSDNSPVMEVLYFCKSLSLYKKDTLGCKSMEGYD